VNSRGPDELGLGVASESAKTDDDDPDDEEGISALQITEGLGGSGSSTGGYAGADSVAAQVMGDAAQTAKSNKNNVGFSTGRLRDKEKRQGARVA